MEAQFMGTISLDRVHGFITGTDRQRIADLARWLEQISPTLRPVAHGHVMTTNGVSYSMVFELR